MPVPKKPRDWSNAEAAARDEIYQLAEDNKQLAAQLARTTNEDKRLQLSLQIQLNSERSARLSEQLGAKR